jgi:hypothetical protein
MQRCIDPGVNRHVHKIFNTPYTTKYKKTYTHIHKHHYTFKLICVLCARTLTCIDINHVHIHEHIHAHTSPTRWHTHAILRDILCRHVLTCTHVRQGCSRAEACFAGNESCSNVSPYQDLAPFPTFGIKTCILYDCSPGWVFYEALS